MKSAVDQFIPTYHKETTKVKIEGHDREVDNARFGTAVLEVELQGVHQAQMYVEGMFKEHKKVRRFYAYKDNTVFAVWARDGQSRLCHVALNAEYEGAKELPFLYPSIADIAVTLLDEKNPDLEGLEQWARAQLQEKIATAVVFHEGNIFAAWERGPDGPILIARAGRIKL